MMLHHRASGAPASSVPGLKALATLVDAGRAALARSGATSAPASISFEQVLEHGLRHLAWLVNDDDVVRSRLNDDWKRVPTTYVPEPFRHL
jgi:hypothetical protein